MIPRLPPEGQIEPRYLHFLDTLARRDFSGDIHRDYASRLVVATDNGVFQQVPQAVLFPRDEADIQRILRLATEAECHDVRLAPRGGGTSTIGCSLTQGLVIDCSRYMNAILEVNLDAGWVRVQPGVVLDRLNDRLAGDGVFFAPNVAPGSRATLGGMANTDGCGKGSRVHGKTSDHVLETRLVLSDGSVWPAAPCPPDALERIKARDDLAGHIHREVDAVVTGHREEIGRVFPKLTRYLSGYNLAQVYDADRTRFNLNKLICGSEGTLAVVSELKLKLTPLPAHKVLFALRYASFDDALRDAEKLVGFDPSAIESLDDNVMGLARNNLIYRRVRDFIEEPDGSTPAAVNLVEFAAAPGEDPDARTAPFQRFLEVTGSDGCRATGYYRADSAATMAALWDLRKGGVGLLGSRAGERKPVPFVEDTVVDPAVLADYVRDFRTILDEYELDYGMFGHIDVGCLHVRPALNLCDPDDERILREVMDRVERLVRHYGGLVWNEHGKGFRSEYNPDYFGPELYRALGRVKRAFDPRNQINPGKIVVPEGADEPLAAMSDPTRGHFDRQIPVSARRAFHTSIDCNGNGACFNYNPRDVMCPSYRVTRDRLHSPKGRASAMREWLRQMAQAGANPSAEPEPRARPLALAAVGDAGRTVARRLRRDTGDDFSHQVWTAMDGCLSCHACAEECPIKVDVPSFKTRFLALYHGRYPRPASDYAIGLLESAAPWLARVPRLANRLAASHAGRRLLARTVGLSDPPALSYPGVADFLRAHPEHGFNERRFEALDAARRERAVFLVQDPFTTFFDAGAVIASLRLLARLGYHPMLLPYRPGGKPLQVKGLLPQFRRVAARQAGALRDAARLGPPLLGIEPSTTLIYRKEYPATLGADAVPFRVHLLEEWLSGALSEDNPEPERATGATRTLFQHCTAATLCPDSAPAWARVFGHLGLNLATAQVGCCGMSGAYGHETRHQAESRGIYDLSWRDAIDHVRADGLEPVAAGYSCRSQIHRLHSGHPRHPAEALLEHLEASPAALS